MDIHDIALNLYTQLVGRQDLAGTSDESRMALGREAYRCAEAFIAAKDAWIREQPVPEVDTGF
ncbi:hypothetical protein [Thermomonas sp. HDW16]|uniref:hypothetical protein n=1 Tax=Thermomonas sp. HDW16 TaxID=2714945 RepID=UPI0014086F8E|nr:hypothetical protein [Thermomonas sp. HDW16]QIL20104.1 hypothetical protein G7079_04775 [Thermomonas sp. HDW16]